MPRRAQTKGGNGATPFGHGARCRRVYIRRMLARAFVAVFTVLIAAHATPVQTPDRDIESQRRNLADVERRVQDLQQDLDKRRARRETLLGELEQHERQIADLARSGHQFTMMIRDQEQALAKLRERLATERKALDRERAALGRLLRSVYAMGPEDRIRMLLDQEDSTRLTRVMAYYDFLNRYRMDHIKAIAQRTSRLDDLTREAEGEKARLSVLAQKQDETRARLATMQKERSELLASLEQTIADRVDRIEELRAQSREMRSLLKQLEQQALVLPEATVRQQSMTQLRGHLPWPLAHAHLLARYGSPKADGSQTWDGVLLQTKEGTEVHAVHSGRVAYADWLRGFGLLIIIEHGDGYMTLYGHNQTLLKEPGEWVAAGDAIALSGSSGGRASPGLYFAIRYRGKPQDPEKWCQGRGAGKRRSSASGTGSEERLRMALLQSGDPLRPRGASVARCSVAS